MDKYIGRVKNFEKSLLLLFGVMLIFFTGCASKISVRDYNSIPDDEILVFGQIKALNMGKKPIFNILLKTDTSHDEIIARIEDDGYFFWHLRPGKYKITYFRRMGMGRIWVDFEVKRELPITYIGTLELIGGVVSQVFIKDNFAAAKEKLKKKFNLSEVNISINLMNKEDI